MCILYFANGPLLFDRLYPQNEVGGYIGVTLSVGRLVGRSVGMSVFWSVDMCRVPRGSLVKCLTHNLGVLGSSRTGSSGFFHGSVLGQDTSEPSLVLVKLRKDMNIVNCRRDMTEILLKAA